MGSLGSSRDCVAHSLIFFMSYSPDAPIHVTASRWPKPLGHRTQNTEGLILQQINSHGCFTLLNVDQLKITYFVLFFQSILTNERYINVFIREQLKAESQLFIPETSYTIIRKIMHCITKLKSSWRKFDGGCHITAI